MGHTDDDLGFRPGAALVHLADEMLDHLFGDIEVGNHTVAHRANGLDRARRAAQHHLGILAHCQNLLFAFLGVVGNHRRLVQHDALALDVDKCVGRTKVDRHIGRKQARKCPKHTATALGLFLDYCCPYRQRGQAQAQGLRRI